MYAELVLYILSAIIIIYYVITLKSWPYSLQTLLVPSELCSTQDTMKLKKYLDVQCLQMSFQFPFQFAKPVIVNTPGKLGRSTQNTMNNMQTLYLTHS